MSHIDISPSQLPPEQEAIRAKCFHPAPEEIKPSILDRFRTDSAQKFI
jgi:hypothetical protein